MSESCNRVHFVLDPLHIFWEDVVAIFANNNIQILLASE